MTQDVRILHKKDLSHQLCLAVMSTLHLRI